MIHLLQAGRAALRAADRHGAGGLTRIEHGIALHLADLKLAIHPDQIRVVQPGRRAALADILPPLCDRLGFAIRDIDAPCPGDILASTATQDLNGSDSSPDTPDAPDPGW